MCGIVGASSARNVVPILIDGIRRLEYRGYDSTGLAVINGVEGAPRLARLVSTARVADLLEVEETTRRVEQGQAEPRQENPAAVVTQFEHAHVASLGPAGLKSNCAVAHTVIVAPAAGQRVEMKASASRRPTGNWQTWGCRVRPRMPRKPQSARKKTTMKSVRRELRTICDFPLPGVHPGGHFQAV